MRINKTCVLAAATFLGTMYGPTIATAQPQHRTLVRLGALARTYSEGIDINDRGQVLAQSENEAGFFRPLLWDRGEIIDIVGDSAPQNAFGLALNNRGQVLGFFNHGPGGEEHAFLADRHGFLDLGTLGGAYMLPAPGPQGLNDGGQVIGDSTTATGEWRGVVWRHGAFTELATLPGDAFSSPLALNNAGQIVGFSGSGFDQYHAVMWDNGRLTDLGTLGGSWSQPFALNESGHVVGYSATASGEPHAFLWDNGQMVDLGRPGETSVAYRINSRGQVLGSIQGADGQRRAVVWTDGSPTMIEPPACRTSTQASALNNRGQVVGYSAAVIDDRLVGGAFVWQNGTRVDLAVLPGGSFSLASDINQAGDITGWAYATHVESQQGVLWTHRQTR